MLGAKKVLVVEADFLVALDVQRIVEEANAAQLVFARSPEEAISLADRLSGFDLAIVELPAESPAAVALAKRIAAANVALVLTSTDFRGARGLAAFPGVPVVVRPFTEGDLLAACAAATGRSSAQP